MNKVLLHFLVFLFLTLNQVSANSLFNEFRSLVDSNDNGQKPQKKQDSTSKDVISNRESKDDSVEKAIGNKSISEDIKYILSMKKDTFESTTDFRRKRKIRLDVLQAKWKKCMDTGKICYHSGLAELTSYDADKELAYFKLKWLKSVKSIMAKVKTIKKVNAKIPRNEARKLFSEKKILPFFINLSYSDDDLVIKKMVVGGQYTLENNIITESTKPKFVQANLSSFLHDFISAGNSPYAPSVAARYYASFVHPYFGIRNATRQDILRDKRKYYRKWPDRNYQLTKYSVIDRYQRAGLNHLEVILEIDWRVASRKRGERTGHSVVTMTLVEDGDSYKITAVRNARIQRDIPVRTSTIRYSPDGSESAETYAPVYFSSNGVEGKMECRRIESYTTCTVTATNHVGTGKGGISISFPNIHYRSSDITLQSSRGFNGDVTFYSQGSQLWSTEYGRKINSSYLLLEGWAKRWRRGETKRIRFSLGAVSTPVQVRAVVVRHRREYIAPADYRTTDQQGYPVAVWHHR